MDIAKVSELLAVVEKCAAHSGKLSAISNAAMARLLEINEAIRQAAVEETKATRLREAVEAQQAKAVAEDTTSANVADPKPPRESETDKIAKSNMRRV